MPSFAAMRQRTMRDGIGERRSFRYKVQFITASDVRDRAGAIRPFRWKARLAATAGDEMRKRGEAEASTALPEPAAERGMERKLNIGGLL